MHSFRSVVVDALDGHHASNTGVARRTEEEEVLMVAIEGEAEAAGGRLSLKDARSIVARLKMIQLMNSKQARSIEGEASAQRAVRLWGARAALALSLWQVRALCMLLVGVSIKLAVADPLAHPASREALQQRFVLGVNVSIAFATQIFDRVLNNRQQCVRWSRPLHPVGYSRLHCLVSACSLLLLRSEASLANPARHPPDRHQPRSYTWANIQRFPGHMCVIVCRLLLLVCAVTLCLIPLRPLYCVVLHAAFAVVQIACLHAQKFRFAISSDREHPIDGPLGRALDVLRLKALRHRHNAAVERKAKALAAQAIQAFSRSRTRRWSEAETQRSLSRTRRWMRSSKDLVRQNSKGVVETSEGRRAHVS